MSRKTSPRIGLALAGGGPLGAKKGREHSHPDTTTVLFRISANVPTISGT